MDEDKIMIYKVLVYGIIMSIAELTFRFIKNPIGSPVFDAFFHKNEPTFNQLCNFLKFIYNFNCESIIFMSFCCLTGAICYQFDDAFREMLCTVDTVYLYFTYIVCRFLNLKNVRQQESEFIQTSNGLDYGSGMANSFFYGYLKLVVPSTGENYSKDIQERMHDYEDHHDVKFPIKKLFILLPKSMNIPNKFHQCSKILDYADKLGEVQFNRAGCISRSYQCSVYKIKREQVWYVAAEGATPLKTYYEAMQHSAKLREYCAAIVRSFEKTLKQLIWDDINFREICEIISYDDLDAKGQRVDIGVIIENRIIELLKL